VHQPKATATLRQETRDAILLAAAKAHSWIDDIASGGVRSFAEIAEREGKVERHIRLLTALAFIPPQRLTAIIDGTGRYDVTVTALAQGGALSIGRQSCRPSLGANGRQRPLIRSPSGP
jgi:site-specific DNA recombinase